MRCSELKNLHKKFERNGRYTWYYSKTEKGKRIWVNLATTELPVAIQKKKDIENNLGVGTASGQLSHQTERYLEAMITRTKRPIAKSTIPKIRSSVIRLIRELGDLPVTHITSNDARRYRDILTPTMATESMRTYVGNARAFFAWCKREGMIRSNPFGGIELPEKKRRPRSSWVKPWDSDRLIQACKRPDLKFVLYCGFHAGLRRNEIVHARPEWFDLDHGVMNVKILPEVDAERRGLDPFTPKDKTERTIPLSPAFRDFAREFVQPSADYCIGPGRRQRKNAYRYDFRRPFEEFMLGQGFSWCTIHTMRHSFVSTLYSSGKVMTAYIAEWTGDEERTLDAHYKHLLPRADLMAEGLRGILH